MDYTIGRLTLPFLAAKNRLRAGGNIPADWLAQLDEILARSPQPADVQYTLDIEPVNEDWHEAELVIRDDANPWVTPAILTNSACHAVALQNWALETVDGIARRHVKHMSAITACKVPCQIL